MSAATVAIRLACVALLSGCSSAVDGHSVDEEETAEEAEEFVVGRYSLGWFDTESEVDIFWGYVRLDPEGEGSAESIRECRSVPLTWEKEGGTLLIVFDDSEQELGAIEGPVSECMAESRSVFDGSGNEHDGILQRSDRCPQRPVPGACGWIACEDRDPRVEACH